MTSTVTPGVPSLAPTLYQPDPPTPSLVETATDGSVVSLTLTTNDFVSPSPPLSVTEQVTVVEPSGNVAPELQSQLGTGSGSSSRSVAETTKETVAPAGAVASSTIGPAGTVRVGAVFVGVTAMVSRSELVV